MNQKLITDIEALSTKAAGATTAHEANSFSQAALNLSQAAAQIHYAELPVPTPKEADE
jgi:hypothetical protein